MIEFSFAEIAEPLEPDPGQRAIEPALRAGELRHINYGDFKSDSPKYLHYGHGGFAVIFRVRDVATGEEFALRCWKHADPPAGTRERVEALDRFVTAHPSPYLLRQQFFDHALYIKGGYRPIIVMPWVKGLSLLEAARAACVAVGSQTDNPVATLTSGFARMVIALQGSGVGHGDLQHENIFERPDGSLCLIDYDSIFVPGMNVGEACPVQGVQAYGHPDYVSGGVTRPSNAYLDTFSSVVIAASLHILAQLPEAFGTHSEENLLFKNDDIADPAGSPFVRGMQARFAGVEPIDPLLAALIAMRGDRALAQVPFATVYSPARAAQRRSAVRPSRFSAPMLPPPPRPLVWNRFSSARFVTPDAAQFSFEQSLEDFYT